MKRIEKGESTTIRKGYPCIVAHKLDGNYKFLKIFNTDGDHEDFIITKKSQRTDTEYDSSLEIIRDFDELTKPSDEHGTYEISNFGTYKGIIFREKYGEISMKKIEKGESTTIRKGDPCIVAHKLDGNYKFLKIFNTDGDHDDFIITKKSYRIDTDYNSSLEIIRDFDELTKPDDELMEMRNFDTDRVTSNHHHSEDSGGSCEHDDEQVLGKFAMFTGVRDRYIKFSNKARTNIILTISPDPNTFLTRDVEIGLGTNGGKVKIARERSVKCETKTTVLANATVKLKIRTKDVYISVFTKNGNKYSIHRENRMLSAGTHYEINNNVLKDSLGIVENILS